jgi:hypothetical protein
MEILYLKQLEQLSTIIKLGSEMHTNPITKWCYKNGLNENQVDATTEYKVWYNILEKSDQQQTQPYTCEVYWFEKVPKEILEAEKLAEDYRRSKKPKD